MTAMLRSVAEAVVFTRDESTPDEVVKGGDHQQGIPFGVPVDECGKPVLQRDCGRSPTR